MKVTRKTSDTVYRCLVRYFAPRMGNTFIHSIGFHLQKQVGPRWAESISRDFIEDFKREWQIIGFECVSKRVGPLHHYQCG